MIGIFDSGIGGLTTVRALMDTMPGYDIIYYGDTARTPYGTKSRQTVTGYALENTEFLLEKGAKIIVIACNTASSHAVEEIKKRYDVPIFEVVTPAVEAAVRASKTGRIGLIGTRATVSSRIYDRKILEINPEAHVYSEPCPLLVPLVEEGWIEKPETAMIVKKYLQPLKIRKIDTLILGCTHYPLLKETISRKIGKRTSIIDSGSAVSGAISIFLAENMEFAESLPQNGKIDFYVSDVTEQFEKTASTIVKKKIKLTCVKK
jgi:glutamate racemase